jgi:subtilisin family serine protease
MKNICRVCFIAITLFLILSQYYTSHAAPSPPFDVPPELRHKFEPTLLKQLIQQPDMLTPFIAHFVEQADLQLAARQATALARRATVVNTLQDTATRTQRGALAFLTSRQLAGRVNSIRAFWIVNAVAATADANTILDLAARPEIAIIKADHIRTLIDATPTSKVQGSEFSVQDSTSDARPLVPTRQLPISNVQRPTSNLQSPTSNLQSPTPNWNITLIQADQVWNALGIDGTGVVVANLDTGVDWLHPALQTKYRGYRGNLPPVHEGNWFDATPQGYLYPGDGHGHGTHTMGTIVGSDVGRVVGVAPGAQWIAVKIFTNAGVAQDSWIHAAFQWVIAPNGDPALAPDIISNSWGDNNGYDTTFLADVQAVRAAGILPVFAAGNNGAAGMGSVGSPGSFDESFTVGATDKNDALAYFSARGPSPLTDHIKPDIVAPGVAVSSTMPGGAYALLNGTSMATPHIAGVAALIKQANSSLTLTDTLYAITSTAVPLTTTLPNNYTGWGRVNAYAAVLQVSTGGILSGVITSGGAPLAGAQVIAADRFSQTVQVTSNSDGTYRLQLNQGVYSVSVFAFGYNAMLNIPATISSHVTTVLNFDLTTTPTGTVRGRVTELRSDLPLSATVSAQNTPASVNTDANGFYTLPLPIGAYTLRATSWQHRLVTAAVTITTGYVITQNFALTTAPSILLVDSGVWYNQSQAKYYRDALDALGYTYHVHSITLSIASVPNLTTLLPYSITFWSSPLDSPGYVGADYTLIQYLDKGGRLFLSGQDVAFWDGGSPFTFGSLYFPLRLYGRFAQDAVASPSATGLTGTALIGITFTVNHTDSARNQLTLDAITLLNENAQPLFAYQNGEFAGLSVSTCQKYRAAYTGFGFEGVGPVSARQQAMQQLIDWLMAPPLPRGLTVSTDDHIAVGLAGQSVTHTLSLQNIGQFTETYTITSAGEAWPFSLWNATFTQTQASTLPLGPCASQTIGIRTDIPSNVTRNISNSLSLVIQPLSEPTLAQTRTLVSKTPATVLMVDDDRWYNIESAYQNALAANQIPFDTFDTHGYGGPSLAYLQMYPIVVWTSGYDWFDPLNASDEDNLARYLDGGGRLFYSAQDYLYVRGSSSTFPFDYLGVLSFTNDVTVTVVNGVTANIIGDGLGPYTLTYPYRNFADYLAPNGLAQSAFVGNYKQASALNTLGAGSPITRFKTMFFAFPFEAISTTQQITVMQQIIGWFSPIGDATLVAPFFAPPTSTFTYTLNLKSTNLAFANSARVTVTLPTSITMISLNGVGLNYNAATRTLTWSGALTNPATLQWTVQGNDPNAWGQTLVAAMTLVSDHGFVFRQRARTIMAIPKPVYLPFIVR